MTEKQPIDTAGTPRPGYLYAVFDNPAEADRAEQEIARMGLQPRQLQGDAAARVLRQETAHTKGLGATITRFVKSASGGEDTEAQRYAIHLEHGRIVLTVPCPDQSTADRLTKAVVEHGAYDVTFFGPWTIEHMSPGENAQRGMPTYEASTGADELITGEILPNEPRH